MQKRAYFYVGEHPSGKMEEMDVLVVCGPIDGGDHRRIMDYLNKEELEQAVKYNETPQLYEYEFILENWALMAEGEGLEVYEGFFREVIEI